MKKFFVVCTAVVGLSSFAVPKSFGKFPVDKSFPSLLPNEPVSRSMAFKYVDSVYNRTHLASYGLSKDVFFAAFKGYQYLLSQGKLNKTNLLTVIDYSQSSAQKRLYVIDLANGRVLFNTYVSHGKNSGGEYATSFSNATNSHKSSLGFIVTGSTYRGRSGYSLHLIGVEDGINDHLYNRSVVMHGSHYVNARRADEDEVGRSFGCPAVPYGEQYDIINTIKDGSCVFIWAPDAEYQMSSHIFNAAFEWPALLKAKQQKLPDMQPPALN